MAEETKQEVLLSAQGMRKEFGITQAVKDVSLTIYAGEIRTLIGENDSGKSTLSNMFTGVHVPTAGKMIFKGKEYRPSDVIDARSKGIGLVAQEVGTIDNLTVAENIALNGELKNKIKFVNGKQIHETARLAMEQVGAHIDPDVKLERLSVANKQMVAICRAIINDAKLLILDEPTTALTAREVDTCSGHWTWIDDPWPWEGAED